MDPVGIRKLTKHISIVFTSFFLPLNSFKKNMYIYIYTYIYIYVLSRKKAHNLNFDFLKVSRFIILKFFGSKESVLRF